MSSFRLTRSHVLSSFAPLLETSDLARRNVFFTDSVIPNVAWTITGHAHSLVGTRYNIEDHCNISFNQLRKRLVAPIKFVVTRVIVDAERSQDGWWACVETRGDATRKTGPHYNNEYIWLTKYNDEGKIVEIRSYFDTVFAEQVLAEPAAEE
ncbi:hypothetical protein NM208_g8492 [Fusarium decemcellulare]|uniref:Uncharacterized protein n=1 Tax=Fusarium decemcellulare TaxID=57161 RepID=A0ACC1S535_9HYPO|nr:hypothetical protein NM208_g8492 [Fusarium decemcellulare]